MENTDKTIEQMKNILKDIKALQSGSDEDVKKEVVMITLSGKEAVLYRAVMAVCKEEHRAELVNRMFLDGMRKAREHIKEVILG